MTIKSPSIHTGDDRIIVTYQLHGNPDEAPKRAAEICVEQTIEFPKDLVDDGDIHTKIIGRIEEYSLAGTETTRVNISYAWDLCANELTQLMNVIYGNISIQPGIKVVNLQLPTISKEIFPGPSYGIEGIRSIHQVHDRPFLATALKPMGLDTKSLSKMAYELALGGIDIIKDDHGLSNQHFAPFTERVKYCCEAVQNANSKTGLNCGYYPNITSPFATFVENAFFAQENGASGLLISPGLMGWDAVSWLRHNGVKLPAMSHPTFHGTYIVDPKIGFSHGVHYGSLMRLAGYDSSVFPYQGGRFSFTHDECQEIMTGCLEQFSKYPPILPAPGGGMKLERIDEIIRFFGLDCILLIGGDLHRTGDLTETMNMFHQAASLSSMRIGKNQ